MLATPLVDVGYSTYGTERERERASEREREEGGGNGSWGGSVWSLPRRGYHCTQPRLSLIQQEVTVVSSGSTSEPGLLASLWNVVRRRCGGCWLLSSTQPLTWATISTGNSQEGRRGAPWLWTHVIFAQKTLPLFDSQRTKELKETSVEIYTFPLTLSCCYGVLVKNRRLKMVFEWVYICCCRLWCGDPCTDPTKYFSFQILQSSLAMGIQYLLLLYMVTTWYVSAG